MSQTERASLKKLEEPRQWRRGGSRPALFEEHFSSSPPPPPPALHLAHLLLHLRLPPSLPMHSTDSRAVSHENQPVHCGPGTIVVVGRRLFWRILCSNSGLDDVAILFSIQNYVVRAINPDTANDKPLRLQTHNLSTRGTLHQP